LYRPSMFLIHLEDCPYLKVTYPVLLPYNEETKD
jgi:hypothetical protein